MNAVVAHRSPAVRAEVNYVVAPRARLHSYETAPPPGVAESNAAFALHTVAISDVRSQRPLSLAADGAELVSRRTVLRHWDDADELRERYYPECAGLIRAATGASEVVIFDHNVRHSDAGEGGDAYGRQRPVFHVHTDYTARSARLRAETVLGRPLAAGQRFAAINLWRPLAGPLRDSPLAICAADSVADRDLVPVELRYADRTGEIYYLVYNPAHRWYYASEMRPDEAWLFKNYDSDPRAVARYTPHSAFLDPTPHREVCPRESIEVRAIALFDAAN